jgi:hypothetical protein
MGITRRDFVASALTTGALRVSGASKLTDEQPGPKASVQLNVDWLLDPSPFAATITRDSVRRQITLGNGLVRRRFCLTPNAATIALDNLMTGASELRGIRPEAIITVNNYELHAGGLLGQPIEHYFLPEWLDTMTADPRALRLDRVEESVVVERFAWKRVPQWSSQHLPWPPPGEALTFHYVPGPETPISGLRVQVHYELYDGIPLMTKRIEVTNSGKFPFKLNAFKAEVLAVLMPAADQPASPPPSLFDDLIAIHVETDYSFGGESYASAAANPAVNWRPDPAYGGSHDEHQEPSLLECKPAIGPEIEIAPGQTWSSFNVFELLHDSSEKERRGLAMRRMYRTLAPWVMENPIFMHARYADPDKVRTVIDQCATTGFEMVILSFGSGFDIENDGPEYTQQMTELAEYARQKGIAIGGYSLLASRGGRREDLVINVNTGKPGGGKFGPSPCLGSHWAERYFRKLHHFFPVTGMSVFENDGSYPGDYCASIEHPGHRGYLDSQWMQWKVMSDFYRWCRSLGIYLTVPDWYVLNGQSKMGMGYTETDWSLPREFQPLIERQNIYDGTWTKTASMGWMHVPLMQYHGGGGAATVEPLQQHLAHYETRLADLFGAGVQAAWRGDRLYDTDQARQVVQRWVDFYKQNRAILDSDIIHLRRPDGCDWDGILHVNSQLGTRGLAMIYNPLSQPITRQIRLPLYYTGLRERAEVSSEGVPAKLYVLDRDFAISVPIIVAANGRTAIFIRAA